MSSNTNHTLTKEQLFACLEYNGLEIGADIINRAKNDDGGALKDIGYEYRSKKQDYSKAIAWYQLAINQNSTNAYTSVGYMYYNGFGVPQNYFTALEFYLKAARDNQINAVSNIGVNALNGKGVPVDKYKALEWLSKSGVQPEKVKELNQEGIHLKEKDRKKTIHQLINEAYDSLRETRIKRELELEQKMADLHKEHQKLKSESQQQLKEKNDTITLLRNLVQSKTNEIQLLQKNN